MNWMKEITNDIGLKADLQSFYNTYGILGIKQAIKLYKDMQQEYICRTKTSVTKMSIGDIYYLEIHEHDISVHTTHGTYHKYGILNKELKVLAPYGFLKCNQSFIVSLNKIRAINQDNLIMVNGSKIHISKNYARRVILEFSRQKNK